MTGSMPRQPHQRRDVIIGLAAKISEAPEKSLDFSDLSMNLKANDDFPITGCALDPVL
jgi:hypothetical protein